MKKGLIFATTLAMALGVGVAVGAHQQKAVKAEAVAAGETVYLKPNANWKEANARFAVYSFSYLDGESNFTWTDMTAEANTDYYKATLPSTAEKVIFCRMNPATSENNWTNKWNQSPDVLLVEKVDEKIVNVTNGNIYTITDGAWDGSGYWDGGSYDIADKPAEEGYYLVGSESNWTFENAPKMTATDEESGNYAELIGYSAKAGETFKVRSYFSKTSRWHADNTTVEEAKKVDIYFSRDGKIYVADHVDPEPDHEYYYSLNGAEAVKMSAGEGNEYFSAELDFAKGDIVTFKQDTEAFAVGPKDSGQQTRVYSTEDGLKFAEAYHGTLCLDVSEKVLWAGQFTPGYYLAGVGGQWNPKLATAAHKVAEEDPAYVVENVAAAAGEEIKFINFPSEGNVISWYKVGYEDEKPMVSTNSEVAFTVVSGGEGDGSLKITNAGTYDIYYNPESGWYSIEDKNFVHDIPETDGYYLVSSESDFKFAGATMMSTEGVVEGNVAELMNYSAKKDEKIKVRGYFRNDVEPDKWSFFSEVEPLDFGEGDEKGNFVFSEAKAVDVFAKWVDVNPDPEVEQFELKFFITAHAERYDVTIYDVLFEGKRLAETKETPHAERATEGVNFEYELPDMNGYYSRELYIDAACTIKYTPSKLSADTTLYAKYTKLGMYMTGDATYSGSEELAWNVDGASYLSSVVENPLNQLEGSVTIPASASAEHPVKVKALRYIGDEVYYEEEVEKHTQWQGTVYDLGDEYSFVTLDKDFNFVFTKGGTYAVYINKDETPKVYFNEGADAFYTKFLTDTGAVCKTDNTTDKARLGEVWDDLKVVYNSLDPTEQAAIQAIGFDGGDEKGDDLHKMMARYHYIVCKYGSEAFENFIFPDAEVIPPSANAVYDELATLESGNNVTIVIVIAIAATSAIALGLLLILKKRKHN